MPCGNPTQRTIVLDGFDGEAVPYELHRSARRRKSISLTLADGQLRLLAPKRTTQTYLDEFLQRRAAWIRTRLHAPPPARLRDQLHDGGALPLLGECYPVETGNAGRRGFVLAADRILIDPALAGEELAVRAEGCLRAEAKGYFASRAEAWAPVIGVRAARIQVRDQKSRWGSASARGTLSFNWRLIFASRAIVDYVVVHELCHLIQPDHSPKYWSLVRSHLPDMETRRRALNAAADSLVW